MSAYTWGLGKNGQLGNGVCETKHVPQKIKQHFNQKPDGSSIRKIKQVDCGALFTGK